MRKRNPNNDSFPAPVSQEPVPSSEEGKNRSGSGIRRNRMIVGRLLTVLGLLMILSAGLLAVLNYLQNVKAGEASAEMLPEVQFGIHENIRHQETESSAEPTHVNPYHQAEVEKSNEMTVWVHNSWSYIGCLNLPTLGLELPVLSELSQYNLGMAPCRHLGSTKSDDLVLAAHNYDFHFGRIRELAPGDPVTFVDMDGVLSTYEVVTVNVIEPTDIDLVTDPSLDLTLYTCTYGGQKRIMAGCQRVETEE